MRVTDWSPDNRGLLWYSGDPYQIEYFDLASGRRTNLLRHPTDHLLYGKFSPDNRWISFTQRTDAGHGRLFVAPFSGLHTIEPQQWIPISEEGADDYSVWSFDGQALYFSSVRDGFTCLWEQRLDPGSHRPLGNAFPLHHFHARLRSDHKGWTVSASRIAIALQEVTGTIWMMTRPSASDRKPPH
jgi:Tol biopolymer transport system component